MAKSRKRPTSDADLKRLVAKWQKRLRLMDWDISAKFDEDGILEEMEAWGACSPQGFLRQAIMLFRHPEEAKKIQTEFDLETIVVHEMLHIFFAAFEHKDHAGLMAEEQAVHTLAILLVMLERKGKNAGRATSFDQPETMIGNHKHCCVLHSFKKERYQRISERGY